VRIYVVHVVPNKGLARISQEGYTTLAAAQAFIESRSDRPEKVTEYIYRTHDLTDYLIYDIQIVT
jgi:hypothetical protein